MFWRYDCNQILADLPEPTASDVRTECVVPNGLSTALRLERVEYRSERVEHKGLIGVTRVRLARARGVRAWVHVGLSWCICCMILHCLGIYAGII